MISREGVRRVRRGLIQLPKVEGPVDGYLGSRLQNARVCVHPAKSKGSANMRYPVSVSFSFTPLSFPFYLNPAPSAFSLFIWLSPHPSFVWILRSDLLLSVSSAPTERAEKVRYPALTIVISCFQRSRFKLSNSSFRISFSAIERHVFAIHITTKTATILRYTVKKTKKTTENITSSVTSLNIRLREETHVLPLPALCIASPVWDEGVRRSTAQHRGLTAR